MVGDEPQNDNSQPVESVESIPLATLLENPDPDFDVVVERRSRDMPGRIERAINGNRPASSTPKAGNPSENTS